MASADPSDLRGAEEALMNTTTANNITTAIDGAEKPATSHTSFFDLPAELRLEIYEYAFADNIKTFQQRLEARAHELACQLTAPGLGLGEAVLPWKNAIAPLPRFLPLRHPLLRVNKKVYAEVLPLHLETLYTYLEAVKTADRENIESSGIRYESLVDFGFEAYDDQRGIMEEFRYLFEDEHRPPLENCLWWTLRDENDRISSEIDCWYEHVEWVDAGVIDDQWPQDVIHRAGLRLFPVVQGMYNWKARSGPRDHPKD